MTTMAEEFKEDFEAYVSTNDWDSVEELIFALGYLDDVVSSNWYMGKFDGFKMRKEEAPRTIIMFKDNSYVLIEFCRVSENNPKVAGGYAYIP